MEPYFGLLLLYDQCILLKSMPLLLSQVMPLYELVTATDFAYSSTVKQNMKKALEEFQKEVDSCQCAPCQGNGVPVLKGTVSSVVCGSYHLDGLVLGPDHVVNPHSLQRCVSRSRFDVYLQGNF